jgi:hypothetical protein
MDGAFNMQKRATFAEFARQVSAAHARFFMSRGRPEVVEEFTYKQKLKHGNKL